MKYLSLLISVFMFSCATACQDKMELDIPAEEDLSVLEKLEQLKALENEEERIRQTESWWTNFKGENNIPYTQDSLAIFFYKGSAQTVEWNGDFNSWSQNRSFQNNGSQIAGTDLWYLTSTFPKDSRLDYKITLNGSNWILDPLNSFQQWSGFGPNSELRMPEYLEEELLIEKPDVNKGSIEEHQIYSSALNYQINYKVYLPFGYEDLDNLASLYVTDGHEYSDERLGNMNTVVDNMIASGQIEPLVVIYVDPRNPSNPNQNRRQDEYPINANFLSFLSSTLIDEIDLQYKTNTEACSRGILGTSLGGINSSYMGAEANEVFKNIGIQSPAYWYRANQIFDLVSTATHTNSKIFMSAGSFNDGLENARRMMTIYEAEGVQTQMMVVNEGHSWGAWSTQLDDLLAFFYGR